MARFEDKAFAPGKWSEAASATNGAATATKAAVAAKRHYITGISLSMSAAPGAAVRAEVKSGTTVLDRFEIPAAAQAPLVHNYHPPLECGVNEDAIITLPALGVGVIGSVVLRGKTLGDA